MPQKTHASAAFTCGFKGFENDSLWFPPYLHSGELIDQEAMEQANLAKLRTGALLEIGCAMAKKANPGLAAELDALAAGSLDLDFFEFGANAPAAGWFRLSIEAPGATAAALAACEGALSASRAPLMAAAAEGALLDFGSGRSDQVATSFLASALGATSKMGGAFSSADQPLAAADLIELRSADGSKRLVACVASCASPGDPLGAMKTFAKIAHASIEASRSISTDESAAFFQAMQAALGGSADSALPERVELGEPKGAFIARPASCKATLIEGLPSSGFEACSNAFLQAVAKKFGPLAALRSAPSIFQERSTARALSHLEWAALSPLFSKLGAAPASTCAPAVRPQAPSA